MSYFLAYSGLLYIIGCLAGLQMAAHDLLVLFSIGLAAIPIKFMFGGFRFSRAGVWCILLFAALCCGAAAGSLSDYSKTAAFAELGAEGETVTVTGTVTYVSDKSLTVQLENGIGLTVVEQEQNGAEVMDRIRATGTLQPYANVQYSGGFNQRFSYAARGVQGLLLTPGVQVEGHDGRLSLYVLGYRARSWMSNRLRSVLDGWVFQLTEAMVTGQNNMDDELRDNLRLSGVSHIAAASGLHVSIFLMLFVLVRRPLTEASAAPYGRYGADCLCLYGFNRRTRVRYARGHYGHCRRCCYGGAEAERFLHQSGGGRRRNLYDEPVLCGGYWVSALLCRHAEHRFVFAASAGQYGGHIRRCNAVPAADYNLLL